jgi:hypothetical protein
LHAITPDNLDELQGKRPLHFRHDHLALAFDLPTWYQYLSRRNEELPGSQGTADRTPVVEARHSVELEVVDVEVAVKVVIGILLLRVHLSDQEP